MGAILLIRGVQAYSAVRVKFELGGWEDGWMEMEVEWNMSDKRFVEL